MSTLATMDVKLNMDSSGYESGMAKAQKSAEGFGKQLKSAGMAMSAAVTLPLVGIATMALKSAGDFEQSMNVMQSITQATGSDMEAMTALALKLGAETSFSAGEAADGMLELGKAGMGTKDIMTAIPGVLSLAAAGSMEVGAAATIAANAVNTFGLEASETTTVANMLAAAANASSADVSDLAQGFQMAGAVFASNNQSMSDLTTSIALMSNAGIAGSDAGTSLKTMMMRLAAPTKDAAAAMADLGLKVYDSNGQMLPFENIVGQLSETTKGLSDAQRNAALSTIFGSDAIRAAVILADAGAEGFANMETQVTAAGAAEEAAAARMKGLNGAMDYLQGSLDSVMITLGAKFLPMLADLLHNVADLATGFTTLSPEVQNAALAFAAVMAAAGPLMLAVTGIGAALAFLLSPIGLIVVAVGALAAAWATDFGGIQEKTAAVMAAIGPMFTNLVTSINAVLEPLGLVAAAMLDAGVNSIEAGEAITALPAALQPVAIAFQELWAGAETTIGALSGIAAAMQDAGVNSIEASEAITALPAALQPVALAFQDLWLKVTAGAAMLQTFLAPAIARVQESFALLGPSLLTLSPSLTALQAAFVALWEAIAPILSMLATAIGTSLAVAMDLGINLLASTLANLPALIGPAIDQITASIKLISTVLTETVALIQAAINGDWSAVWASAKTIFEAFTTFFKDTLFNLTAVATAVFTVIKDSISNTLKDMGIDVEAQLTALSTFWANLWQSLVGFIQPVIDAVAVLKKAIEDFSSWMGSISIPNPFAAISGGIGGAVGAVRNAVGSIIPHAMGGAVNTASTYLVGENGPELFRSNVAGSIIPTHELGGGWGGSGSSGAAVNIGEVSVYNEIDIRELAFQVAGYMRRRA